MALGVVAPVLVTVQLKIDRAVVLYHAGRPEKACAELEEARLMEPENSFVLYCLSICYLQLDRPEEAEQLARDALGLQPGHPFLHDALSDALSHQGRDEEALRELEHAIEANPENASYFGSTAYCLMRLGRYDEAMERLDRGLAIEPNHYRCMIGMALCLCVNRRRGEARLWLEDLLTHYPESSEARVILGKIERGFGNSEKSEQWLEQALELDAENQSAARELRELGSLKLSTRDGRVPGSSGPLYCHKTNRFLRRI